MHSLCHAQTPVLQLSISGKDTLETSVIDSISYTHNFKNLSELKKEANTVHQKLLKLGYLDLTIRSFSNISDSVIENKIALRNKYKTLTIFYDNTSIPTEIITGKVSKKATNTYFTIPFTKTEETIQYLTNHLVNQGNTFSSLSLSQIKKENNAISAHLITSKTQTRVIDSIIIKGYHKFPPSYLKHYSQLKKGMIFKKEGIINKSLAIDNLGFAKNIKPPEVLFDSESTKIYLYLEKKSANTFDGFLGFSNDAKTRKLEINGYLNLNLINNLNFGEQLTIIYKSDGNEQQRFEADVSLPYLFKTRIGMDTGLSIFKKDSTFLITDQKIHLNYLIGNKNNLFAGYRTTISNNLLKTPLSTINVGDYTSSFFRIGFDHTKKQNDKLFPIKNQYTLVSEFGSRKTDTDITNQIKTTIDVHYLLTLNRRNLIFIGNSVSAIFSENLLVNELARFGGMNSIRGFEENSINASLYNVLNTEYLYVLAQNLYAHSIIDYAYFEDKSANLTNNLTSIGFGLGLHTQTGLFRMIFANGKDNNSNFKFSNTKVHVSLTAKF